MRASGDYYVTVIEDTRIRKIIGAATLVLEHKFIHGCGSVSVRFLVYKIEGTGNIIYCDHHTH